MSTWTDQERRAFDQVVADDSPDRPLGRYDWLVGRPMDPAAVSLDPLPTLKGFPFLHPGTGALISGPTGKGRSSLMQAGIYDAAMTGTCCLYLGVEVTAEEFDARAGVLADVRGDEVNYGLREELARARYLSLSSTIVKAWDKPDDWVAGVKAAYMIVVMDPLSSVAGALDFNFDKGNADYIAFHDRLVQPLVDAGIAVALVDNIGHDQEASGRAKGASAKGDKADLDFSCRSVHDGLVIRCKKSRPIRATVREGDEWLFERDTQRIERKLHTDGTAPAFRPTVLMERVSWLLEGDPGLSKRSIRSSVKGGSKYIDLALELLLSEGFVEVRRDGQTDSHHSLKPFRDGG
jgi:hypothetical protein